MPRADRSFLWSNYPVALLGHPENHERAAAKIQQAKQTEIGNDLPHHDLDGRRMDRSLADTVSVRRERSDHVALAEEELKCPIP